MSGLLCAFKDARCNRPAVLIASYSGTVEPVCAHCACIIVILASRWSRTVSFDPVNARRPS